MVGDALSPASYLVRRCSGWWTSGSTARLKRFAFCS
jgi:hypothetical protein